MAIQSYGYDSTIDATVWSQIEPHLGGRLDTVQGRDDFVVSINGAATLTVNVAAGPNGAIGAGIWDSDTAAGSVVLNAVTTSGATRWDAIVLHRVWSTSTTTLTKVQGVAAANAPAVLPSGLASTPGNTYDQVLALVQCTYGSTLPTQVIDRRIRKTDLFVAPTLSALPPATLALWGTHAELANGAVYKVDADTSGGPAWIPATGLVTQFDDSAAFTAATGWSIASPLTQRGLKNGPSVTLDLMARRTGANIVSSASAGNFPDTQIGTVPSTLAPDRTLYLDMQYGTSSGSFSVGGKCRLLPNGQLWLQSGVPGWNIETESNVSTASVFLSATFNRKAA